MSELFLLWQDKLTTISLIYARIVPIFILLPVLNKGVLSSMLIRNSIIFTIIIGLWPMIDTSLPLQQLEMADYLAAILKEVVVGATIGFVLALPFWIFNAMGTFIDVARGSSMGSLIDPTSGQESSEIQNFINYCVCAMYLQLGGLRLMLEVLQKSYQSIGLTQSYRIDIELVMQLLGQVFENGFVLAAPVLLTLLLSESLLGLLARFTPQLSAFSVSMTIKSTIAIFVLSLYFWMMLPDRLPHFMVEFSNWHLLKAIH